MKTLLTLISKSVMMCFFQEPIQIPPRIGSQNHMPPPLCVLLTIHKQLLSPLCSHHTLLMPLEQQFVVPFASDQLFIVVSASPTILGTSEGRDGVFVLSASVPAKMLNTLFHSLGFL